MGPGCVRRTLVALAARMFSPASTVQAKCSVAAAAFKAAGGAYYNPDRATLTYAAAGLEPRRSNARAWRRGVEQLDRAVRLPASYAFETTLGGRTGGVPGDLPACRLS
jgi:hypothetical protein